MKIDVKLDDHILKNLIKAMRNQYKVKIGVLGTKNAREGSGSNAAIAKKHEFGEVIEVHGKAKKLPERSILRTPISDNLYKYLENSGALSESVLEEAVKSKTMKGFMEIIALTSETIVQDAFDSNGFGKWPLSNYKYKKVHQTLVETQQLRNSIASIVEKDNNSEV